MREGGGSAGGKQMFINIDINFEKVDKPMGAVLEKRMKIFLLGAVHK